MTTPSQEAIDAAEKEIANRDVESTRGMFVQSAIEEAYPLEHKQAVAMTRVCLWYLKQERQAIIDAKGEDAVPAYLHRCIDKLSCFESSAEQAEE